MVRPRATGAKVVGYVADNEHDEAAFVAGEIDRLVDNGEIRNSDVAVFYRTNAQSRVFEDVFLRVGLPYKVVGGVRFYERREIRDALAYLRVLSNPDDTVSLRRILNVPKRGIGERGRGARRAVRGPRADLVRRGAAGRGRAARTHGRAGHPVAALHRRLRARCSTACAELVEQGEGTAELLEAVYARTGYTAELEASDDPQDASRLENLAELVTVAREFAGDAAVADLAVEEAVENAGLADAAGLTAPADDATGEPEPGSLAAFLERVALVADADSIPDNDEGMVTLMTLHTAKGLEFPVVFLTGLGGRGVPAHAGDVRPGGAGRGAPAGLRRHHPRPRAALPVPGADALGVRPAQREPGVAVPRRGAGDAGRLEAVGAGALGAGGPVRVRAAPAGRPSDRGHWKVPERTLTPTMQPGRGRPGEPRQVRPGHGDRERRRRARGRR